MKKNFKMKQKIVAAFALAAALGANAESMKARSGHCGEGCVRVSESSSSIEYYQSNAINPGYSEGQLLTPPGYDPAIIVASAPARESDGLWYWLELHVTHNYQTIDVLCNGIGDRRKDESKTHDPGHTEVSPPNLDGNGGQGESPSSGTSGCQGCQAQFGKFDISIGMGRGAFGGAVGKLTFRGDMTTGDMLASDMLELVIYEGVTGVTGSLEDGTIEVTNPSDETLITTISIVEQMDGLGNLQSMTLTIIPAEATAGAPTTHVFSRASDSELGDGLQYSRTENEETETLRFLALAPAIQPNGRITGQFAAVDVWGNTHLLIAPVESTATFQWHEDSNFANGGYYSGELIVTEQRVPAGEGEPVEFTHLTYRKIGNTDYSKLVLCNKTISLGSGTAVESATTYYGYDEEMLLVSDPPEIELYSNDNFGHKRWELRSDGSWALYLPEMLPEWNGRITYGDMLEYTPWKEGPGTSVDFSDWAHADVFFSGLAAQVNSPGSNSTLLGCLCRRKMLGADLWREKIVSTFDQVVLGKEYKYAEDRNYRLNLADIENDVALDYCLERWDALGNRVQRTSNWAVFDFQYETGGWTKSPNLNLTINEAGLGQVSVSSVLEGGYIERQNWQIMAAVSSTTIADGIGLPLFSVTAEFPRWASTLQDSRGRTLTETSSIRMGGVDHTIETISTTYTGESAYTRSAGGKLLDSQEEEVVANGMRTSRRTDANGVTRETVTDEATGELISETKIGVPASGTLPAQPDVTTHYAKSLDANTGETTLTVTQTSGTATRTLSTTVTDALGRTKSVIDEIGRVTSYLYEHQGRKVTITMPGGLTRITENYRDGRLKSVTGTAGLSEFHDYAVNDGTNDAYEEGSITETVYYGTNGGSHWRKITTNFLGQVLREEEPSPVGANAVIVTTHEYNEKGLRVLTQRTGTADLRFEYDTRGQLSKQGYDLNGDDELTATSNDVLTEVVTSYEQQAGRWVEKTVERSHTQSNGQAPQEVIHRRGLAESSYWQSTTSPDGSVTIRQDSSDRVSKLHLREVLRSADGVATPVMIKSEVMRNGLLSLKSVPEASLSETYAHNGFGQILTQAHPVSGTSTWTYDAATGQVETHTPSGGSTVIYSYYPAAHANAGQMKSVTASGEVTRYAYNAQGRQTHQWGAGAQPIKYVYDDFGRLHEMYTYQGGSGWDSEALPAAFATATAAVTTWDYHPGTNALWKKTDAAGHAVVYSYETDGSLGTKTNARNITTTYAYQLADGKKVPGRVTGLNYGDDTPDVSLIYKRNGELEKVTDAAGLSTYTGSAPTRTVTVTGSGLMAGLEVTRNESWADKPATVLAKVGGASVVSHQYDWTSTGLLHQAWQGDRTTGAGGSGLRQTWSRNVTTGRLTSITSAAFGGGGATHGVTRSFSHTSAGEIDKQWFNAGLLGAAGTSVQGFDYDLDAHGRRETVRPYLPDGAPPVAVQPPGWKFGYNERSEVEQADRFKPGAATVEAGLVDHQRRSYGYDGMGNRETATLGTTTADLRQTGYSVNELQQYDGVTHSRSVEITGQAAAGAVVELTLEAGSPITVDRTLPQHQSADPHSFRYMHTVAGTEARWLHVKIKASIAGVHLTQQGFVYVPPASETVVHDDDGNLIEDAQWTYTWDAENRLTSATQKALPVASGLGLPAPARKKLTFAYDYRHRRIAKRVYQLGASTSVPETPSWNLVTDQRFVYDGWNMIAELDHTTATSTGLAGSGVSRTFQWGPDLSGTMSGAGGVGGLLSLTKGGVMYAVCSDANGNVTGLVPTSGPGAGKLIARYDYDPFGNRITDTGTGAEICPFGFSTKYRDEETGIIHYDLRDYRPSDGRWMSRDRIGERGGINLYGMCGNDAVNRVDRLGLVQYSMPAKAPNCIVRLRQMHGPGFAEKYMAAYQKSVDQLALEAGWSAGLFDEEIIDTYPRFYGRLSVLSCEYQEADDEPFTIPDIQGNDAGVGYSPSALDVKPGGFFETPFSNGGHGKLIGDYGSYIKQSWAATLRTAQKLAVQCGRDPCCLCKQITAVFEAADDAADARNGKSTISQYNEFLGSKYGQHDNTKSPTIGEVQGGAFPNLIDPNPGAMLPTKLPFFPPSGKHFNFTVIKSQ